MTLFTAGYEGLTIEAFLARLKQAGIEKIVDVREYPLSRKPGFSKRALAEHLMNNGIAYEHVPALGCPKPIRNQYKVDGSWARYAKDFRAYIATQDAVVLDVLADAASYRTCLICYEADASFCHRSLIAEAGQKLLPSVEVVHLPTKITTLAELLRAVA